MKHLPSIPTNSSGTGTAFGWSFIKTWKQCPMLWYNRYIRPVLGGTGAEQKFTSGPLAIGSIAHAGLEAWRFSGWTDGQYQLDAAIEGARAWLTENFEVFETPELAVEAQTTAEQLLIGYHERWGPGGARCDYPEYQVAADADGHPLIEREFQIDLSYGGYIFTTRPDAIFWHHDRLEVKESKTCDVSRVGAQKLQAERDGQFTGQIMAVAGAFPEHAGGLQLDLLVKRAVKIEPYQRHPISKTALQFEIFRSSTIRTLVAIDTALDEYHDLVAKGMDYNDAARVVFDSDPPGETCYQPGRRCAFFEVCSAPGNEEFWFQTHVRPRSESEEPKRIDHDRKGSQS